MKRLVYALLAAGVFYSCTAPKPAGPHAQLLGTWSWLELQFHGKDTTYTWRDLKGQLIFTDQYYSTIYVYQEGPRDRTRPGGFDSLNVDELKKALSPVTANSGTYTIESDSIVYMRDVALWPNAMADGNKRFTIPMPTKASEDTLYWKIGDYSYTWVRRK